MSVFHCGQCDQRTHGKLGTIYWAWFNADDRRIAYRQRLCAPCFANNVLGLYQDAETNPNNCPSCHAGVGGDLDAIYATVYLPKREAIELVLPACAVCAVPLREQAKHGAKLLEDREEGVRGRSPSTSPTNAWDAMGLAPAEAE